jgi:hypothetical protein
MTWIKYNDMHNGTNYNLVLIIPIAKCDECAMEL